MVPFASAVAYALACIASAEAPHQASSKPGLRTFVVEKSADERAKEDEAETRALVDVAPALPQAHDAIHATLGVGYVQGADWGSQFAAAGAFAGVQMQLDALVTRGSQGLLFNAGTMVLSDPDGAWRADGGDLFSRLRGAARGARLTWRGWGDRTPSIAVYATRPGLPGRPAVAAYRDQIRLGAQTILDAEIASDASHVLESHLARGRFDLALSYRRLTKPAPMTDRAVQASVDLWHGVRVGGGVWRSEQAEGPSDWRTISVRVPFSRAFDLTLERTYTASGGVTNRSWAAMGGVNAGSWRFFHRYQQGETETPSAGFTGVTGREQLQSMTAYAPNPRVNLTLQLATQWTDAGRPQRWEELDAAVRLTKSTVFEAVTAVPDFTNLTRLRARLVQNLPRQFSIEAEYGHLAAFQDEVYGLNRSRVRVMLRKTVDIATPARGGGVSGRVVDQAGRPVAGARVTLGPYAVDTSASGAYAFHQIPRGEFDLALDATRLPADYAWDGRTHRLPIVSSTRDRVDLLVAPLNTIHGAVFCDRNGNGRFDEGEAAAGVVVHLGDRVTATDASGAYNFYNVWPGRYMIQIDKSRMPAEFEATALAELAVVLGDEKPVTGADFRVALKSKPIIWREIK
jgi:hypothetical protein